MTTCWLKPNLTAMDNSTHIDSYAVCGKLMSTTASSVPTKVSGASIADHMDFPDTYNMGSDIASYTNQNETSCVELCGRASTCSKFVFSASTSGGACFLESPLSDGVAFPGVGLLAIVPSIQTF